MSYITSHFIKKNTKLYKGMAKEELHQIIMIKLLIETENYINQYHIHDIDFIHRLGFRAIIQMRDIENCLTFHPESRLSKKDIISYSKKYLDTPIVKKYISQSWITDCYSIKSLFRYIIIKYRLFNIYYLYIKHIKRRCI